MPDNAAPEFPFCPPPDGVLRRLTELGTPLPILRESMRRGFLAGRFVHAGHAKTYSGLKIYHETNGELRAAFAGIGWRMNEDENIPRSIRPDGLVIVTALAGDERTGLHGPVAQPRRPRGDAGIRIIRQNAQLFLDILDADDPALLPITDEGTWFLLYRRVGDIVRSELSLALGVTDDGGLIAWVERLILPEFDVNDGGGTAAIEPPQNPPEVDVPVTRRTA